MSAARKNIPGPDLEGTDPDEVLRSRLLSTPVGHGSSTSTPAHTPPIQKEQTSKGGTRPDPQGMKRTSLYVTGEAASALEQAADQVLEALGGDVPRHVALSALLEAGARQASDVAHQLVQQRAADLSARLHALQHEQDQP